MGRAVPPQQGLVAMTRMGRLTPMKGFSAFMVFLLKTVLLGAGVVMATNGKGVGLLVASVVVFAVMFIMLGCLANAPKD